MALGKVKKWQLFAALLFLFIGFLKGLDWYFPLPQPYSDKPAQVVLAANGEPLRSFGNAQGVHRYQINTAQVSPFYLEALLAYEDRWFYYHPGVNPVAILRALGQWIAAGEVVSGASTLSMQVARLLTPHSKTVCGKLSQALRALQLEWYLSKDEVLELYLNLAPFGGNLEGVEAASRFYFGKSALNLNQAEAALLVALPQRPSAYRPDRHPERARQVRNKVLHRLVAQQLMSQEQALWLTQQAIRTERYRSPLIAPLLARRLASEHRQEAVIRTTIESAIQYRLKRLMTSLSYQLPPKTSAAILIADNATGKVIAYQGSVDFLDRSRYSHIDMALATRSPGSTLKPFIYGLALEHGLIHSKSLLSDVPTTFNGYKPSNFDNRFRGPITASYALRLSLNVPVVQLLNRLSPSAFDEALKQAGVQLHHPQPNLAIGLGGTGTQLAELVKLYRSLANQGKVSSLTYLGAEPEGMSHQLLSPAASWLVWHMLTEIPPPDRTTRKSRRKIAWKSGTSYGFRDTWAIGVSPDHTVGVWIGRPDGSPLVGHMGASLAGPALFDVFDFLPEDKHELLQPEGVEAKTICWPGGMSQQSTPKEKCERTFEALTLEGKTPPTMESEGRFVRHHQAPLRLQDWLKEASGQTQAVRITSLRTGQHYFSDQLNQLELEASESEGVRWYVNGQLYEETLLDLTQLKGLVQVSACNRLGCDLQKIVVH